MRFILRLKHWQLFAVTWGVPLAVDIYSMYDPMILFRLFPFMMTLFIMGVFGWIWAIGNVLHDKLPVDAKFKVEQFRIFLIVPILYIIFILVWLDRNSFVGISGHGERIGLTILPIILGVHLLCMVLIIFAIRFAAKTLKSVELGRLARFGDYAQEFFLIWFSPIGIWILQPRLNKLTNY